MEYAACTAAARFDACGGPSFVTRIGLQRRSMPFTASKTAACTMAAHRVETGAGVTGGVSVAWTIMLVQSATSSVTARPGKRASELAVNTITRSELYMTVPP